MKSYASSKYLDWLPLVHEFFHQNTMDFNEVDHLGQIHKLPKNMALNQETEYWSTFIFLQPQNLWSGGHCNKIIDKWPKNGPFPSG